jgi:hypothetical protein
MREPVPWDVTGSAAPGALDVAMAVSDPAPS